MIRENIVWIIFLIVAAITLVKRISIMDPHLLSWDEVVYVTQGREMVELGFFLDFEQYRPPLWSFCLGGVFFLFGVSPITIELASWVMGLLMMGSFLLLYNTLLDKETATLASVLTLTLPVIWLWIGARVMSEALFILLTNLFWVVTLPKVMQKEGRLEFSLKEGLLIGVLFGLATLTRFTSFLILIPVVIFMVFNRKIPKINISILITAVSFLAVISVLFILSFINLGTVFGFWDMYLAANSAGLSGAPDIVDIILTFALIVGYLLVLVLPFVLIGILRGVKGFDKKTITYTLWLFLPLLFQALLRIDSLNSNAFDIGSGGLFVRLIFPWASGGIIIAAIELRRLSMKRNRLIAIVFGILIVNCALSGIVLSEYRTSSYYQQIHEINSEINSIWSGNEQILTNWVLFIYPSGREYIALIPENYGEYNSSLDTGIRLIIQHTGNYSLQNWWNPEDDGFSVVFRSSLNLFIIWER